MPKTKPAKNSKSQLRRLKQLSQRDLDKGSKLRLFIDPASISSGWALFKDAKLLTSGTIAVPKKLNVWDRLALIRVEYNNLGSTLVQVDAVHFEKIMQTPRVQKAVHWSVGVIGAALAPYAMLVDDCVTISSWQAHCSWKSIKDCWEARGYTSEDAMAAVEMGRWFVDVRRCE